MTISDMAFVDGGMVPQSADPGLGQEGGIPMSGAAQPAAATPQQRLASAGGMVQSLLVHGMRKHNLVGPDGKPMRVGAYAGGGLVRSFADGGFVDAQNEPQGEAAADAGDGGGGPETAGAIPSSGGGQDYGLSPQLPASGSPPGSMQGPNSFASTGSVAPSVMQYVTGADAPPDEVMDQLHAAFKQPGGHGGKAALASVAAAGERSPDLGFSVLQGYRKRYDRARAEAGKAFDMGNLDGGVTAMNDAYSNFPTDESASFSHDGNKIHAAINGQAYQIDPRMASELLAKGAGGHFDNQAFTGLDQPFATLGAVSTVAERQAAQTYPGGRNVSSSQQKAPYGGLEATRVAGPYEENVRSMRANQARDDIARTRADEVRQKENDRIWEQANGQGKGGLDAEWKALLPHLGVAGKSPAEIEELHQQFLESKGAARSRAAPATAVEPPKEPGFWERLTGHVTSNPPKQATQQANPATWKQGDPVPAGYKEQQSKTTGQRRIVPIGP